MLRERNKISMITLQGRMRYLNSFWTFLQKEEIWLRIIRWHALSRPDREHHQKAFSAQELEALRMACVRPRDRALIEFLYATGVRVSELCSLNAGDIDLYKQEFKVMGKGRKERRLYISDGACFHLYRYSTLADE
ncbi:MAG: tyrosine-type recombinase/integrase [Clostridium fessum]